MQADNSVGSSAFSDASRLTTDAEPVRFARVQYSETEDNNPTIELTDTPTAGNLLVAIGFHRRDAAEPTIDGWDQRLNTHFQTNDENRRGLTVWTRVAEADEPREVQFRWSPTRETRFLVQELSAGLEGVEWSFEATSSNDTGDAEDTSLPTGETPPLSAGDLLVIGAFGSRDDPESDVSFDGLADGLTIRGSRSVATAFGHAHEEGALSTIARWSHARRATAAVIVFRVVR